MAADKKVLIAVPGLEGRAPEVIRQLERAGFALEYNREGRALREDELIGRLPGVFATVAASEPYNERVFTAAPDLRVVARMGVGYDRVDVDAATRHGAAVAMAFGANHEAVADYAFALIAALGSELTGYHRKVLGSGWGGNVHLSLWQATVGIVGFGRIGQALARRCRGFEMRVVASDPQIDPDHAAQLGVELLPLDRVLAEADFVSIHAPLTPETEHLIDRERLALMKATAYLVNTARGGLVDETALIEALEQHRIAGAGLDVFELEPLPAGSPLRQLDNVLLTPHCAGTNTRSLVDMLQRCVTSILDIHAGRNPGDEYLLNPKVLGTR